MSDSNEEIDSATEADCAKYERLGAALAALNEETSTVKEITKLITKALGQIRQIGQEDSIRRDAITQCIRCIGQDWIRDIDDRAAQA